MVVNWKGNRRKHVKVGKLGLNIRKDSLKEFKFFREPINWY